MRVANNLDHEIGRRLRQSRLFENLTQEALAQRIGISFQQLQKYESGANRVSSSRLWAISRVLGLPITYFYDGLEDNPVDGTGREPADQKLSDRTIRVAHMLEKMTDDTIKDRLYDLIRALSKMDHKTKN